MGKSIIVEKSKKVSEEQGQTALFAGLSIFALMFPLGQYVWPYHIIGNQMQSTFLLILAIYFLAILGVEYINGRMSLGKVTWSSLLALALFGAISCVHSGRPETSIYSDGLQAQGFVALLSYYILFLGGTQLKEKAYRRRLMQFLILGLGFISLYGVLQFLKVPFIRYSPMDAAVYPAKNQNFYGVYPVLFTGLMLARAMYGEKESESKVKKIWCHLLLMLGYAACISADSLLVYAGMVMQFLLLVFLEFTARKHRYGKALLVLLEFFLVFFLCNRISGGQVMDEVSSLSYQIELEGSLFGDYVGTGRMRIWKDTLKAIPEIWAFGCGIECTGAKFGINDAHNEYLQLWAEQGVFALISYLVFLFSLFIPGLLQFIKKESYDSDFTSKAAMFAFFGYIAQAFVNVRVLQTAPYFWFVCGLLYVRKYTDVKGF